jgi:copper chaperone CopZ
VIRVHVEGMSCASCARHVKEALQNLSGVTAAQVSLGNKLATVQAVGELSDEQIRGALDEEGYEAMAITRG